MGNQPREVVPHLYTISSNGSHFWPMAGNGWGTIVKMRRIGDYDIVNIRTAIIVASAIAIIGGSQAAFSQSSSAKSKGLWGAGIGAVAGGLIGGDIGGAAVGALAGGGVGYLVGNEEDKKRAEEQAAAERAAREQAAVTADPATAYQPPDTNELVGTTWRIVSYDGDKEYPDYASVMVTFPANSTVSTIAMKKDGTADSWVETYRLVEDVIMISGKNDETGEDYVRSFKYSFEGDQMTATATDVRVVMEKVQ